MNLQNLTNQISNIHSCIPCHHNDDTTLDSLERTEMGHKTFRAKFEVQWIEE